MEQKTKGQSVRKIRKVAIILFSIVALWNLANFTYYVVKVDFVIDITKSNLFIFATVFFIVNLITDSKEKLAEIKPWYKSKWGWLEIWMLFNVVGLVIYLINITFLK